jgi:parallel beta-helix repeat protein
LRHIVHGAPEVPIILAALLLAGCCVLAANRAQGANRYLATNGVDSGSCTSLASPCRTFNYVDSRSASGDVVHVLPGTYNLTASTCIVTNTRGVTWQSDAHGTATINGGGHCLYMWHNSGTSGYLKIFGFQFTGVQVNSSLNSFGVLLEGSEGNFEVAYNTFHDFGSSSSSNNFGAALSPAPWGNSNYTGRTCSVHDNIFRNIAPGGSFLYNGYSLYAICGNNGGDPDPRIYNNLIYNEGSIAIQMWHAADHIHLYNNTIDKAHMGILVGIGDQGAVNGAVFDVSNNIVSNSYYGIYAEDGSGHTLSPNSTFDNNLTYNNAIDWRYKHSGKNLNLLTSFRTANNISGNPLYVGGDTGHYPLQGRSPAAGKGLHGSYAPVVDLDGIKRSNQPSIGAYEPEDTHAHRRRELVNAQKASRDGD